MFAPSDEEVYPEGFATTVAVSGDLVEVLDGDPSRRGPEHFRGVTTVVAKLLNCAGPDLAFFGQKDAQQALVVRRMVADLDFPVEIVVVPTVREADGLAKSSRNAYLEGDDRTRAAALNRALQAVETAVASGEHDVERALAPAHAELAAAGIEPEYLEARDAKRLAPGEQLRRRSCAYRRCRAGRPRASDRQPGDQTESRQRHSPRWTPRRNPQ